ncbi:FeS cluster assembly protein SufD [Labrenzia sp. THAF191b]|uniref:Fe-S cluster assembly protein SufD n=1 Tax=unclassified Labrenzia TaxID=2648686 RepID=UPI0012680802|nr:MULTISPECIES: Fe-S cluster assembly protein SufD [unclassified Labrenzia]QFT00003.1 FeS cluster assembly protein SufD [Labrenzia sp. THAF191b]QFT06316.1 FeS cluster assembly protein SufD [Labrenzia sp. THAF191a]QFT17860.1 FeS cluster assembly protein SufD [Labrenzia sp. THAF187b]
MNASAPIKHTQAESDLLERFDSAKDGLAGSVAVKALREAALGQIRDRGLPHRRVEEYKYSDLRAYMKSAASLAGATDAAIASKLIETQDGFGDLDRYRIVVANGSYLAELSDVEALAGEGVTLTNVADALAGETGTQLIASPKTGPSDGVVALNTAFLQGGVVVTVEAGVEVSKPVELVQVATSKGAQAVRNRIKLGEGAKLRLLETFVGDTGEGELNTVFDYDLADKAALAATRLIVGKTDAAQLFTTIATLGAETELKSLGFIAGPQFTRNQQFINFTGENSEAKIYGVTMAGGKSLADQTLIVDHAVPHCNSREFFKTVLDGEARGVYQGRINVAQHAQKTDGEMMTQALLLSEDAEMANKPELEIFADDVLCAHGATSGQIDEDLLFYLRARGIPEDEAKTLLVLAFLSEAIEEYGEDDVTEGLEARVRDWLANH